MRIIRAVIFVVLLSVLGSTASFAQNNEPPLPPPLENLVAEGAQARYLGNKHGLDGWITIKGGQEQYFYVTENGQAFVMGLMFDRDGKLETVRQVKELQQSSDGPTLDMFASEDVMPGDEKREIVDSVSGVAVNKEFKSPAEQLYSDVEDSNWVRLGSADAPFIYTFVDPQCGYCHAFIKDLRRDYIENGAVQVRIIPVGFREDTRAQASLLLAVPDAEKRWYSHLDGDSSALPVSPDVNQQGVQRNLAIMQSWKVNVTPFTVYKTKSGDVKIVQGRAQDIRQILSDIR